MSAEIRFDDTIDAISTIALFAQIERAHTLAALVGSSAHACVRTAPCPEDWLRMLHPITEIIVVYLGCLTHRF